MDLNLDMIILEEILVGAKYGDKIKIYLFG